MKTIDKKLQHEKLIREKLWADKGSNRLEKKEEETPITGDYLKYLVDRFKNLFYFFHNIKFRFDNMLNTTDLFI